MRPHIPNHTLLALDDYYEHLWLSNKGEHESTVLASLPESLRNDLKVALIFKACRAGHTNPANPNYCV